MVGITMQEQMNAVVSKPTHDAIQAALRLATGLDITGYLSDVEAIVEAREEESRRATASIIASFTPAAPPPPSPEALAGRRGDCCGGFGRELVRLLREQIKD